MDGFFRVNTDLAAAKVYDQEAIVINTATGRYYDLEGSAPAVWLALETGAGARDIARSLSAQFDVDEQTALADVEPLLRELVAEGLVVEGAAEAAARNGDAVDGAPARGEATYAPPGLTTFTDMQDLLAADPPLPASYTPMGRHADDGTTNEPTS